MKKSIYEWAIKYRDLGWSVFPVKGKSPAIKEVIPYRSRLPNNEELKEWFEGKEDVGIALITGKLSGIAVIDDDSMKKGGVPAKLLMEVKSSVTSKTGGGGTHYFVKYEEGFGNKVNIGNQGIDIRSEGGYVVIPPTKGAKNEYVWLSPPSKENLLKLPRFSMSPEIVGQIKNTNYSAIKISDYLFVGQGGRNDALFRLARSLLNRIKEEQVLDLILNVARNYSPPYPESEARLCFSQALKYYKQDMKIIVMQPKTIEEVAMTRIEERKLVKIAPSTGAKDLDNLIQGFIPGNLYTLTGETNSGKCHGKGTEIMMFDGSIKKVEDIKIGDKLMGINNQARSVLALGRGREEMYNIKQQYGKDYIVNKNHILSLKCSPVAREQKMYKEYVNGGIINISLLEYQKKGKNFKKFSKGWKQSIDFSEKEVKIPPYILGLWLGNGTSRSAQFTNMDNLIIEELQKYAKNIGLECKIQKEKSKAFKISITNGKHVDGNTAFSFQKLLRDYNLIRNKHIPDEYRINSRNVRLELLAGLIDTDGYIEKHYSKKSKKPCWYYGITLANKKLAEDVLILASSLGFNVSLHTKKAAIKSINYETEVYRLSIMGDYSLIPTKLKKIPYKRIKSIGFSKFDIESIGEGDYYGFTLDGDGLYLLSDCTVTHNTILACNFAINLTNQKKKVLYIALETGNKIVEVMASIMHDKPYERLTDEDILTRNDYLDLFIDRDIPSVTELETVIRGLDIHYDLIIIDHIGYFVQDKANYLQDQANVLKQLRYLTKEKNTAIMLIAHLRKRDSRSKSDWKPTADDISGSASFKQDSTDVMIIIREKDDFDLNGIKVTNKGFLFVVKTKGRSTGAVDLYFNDVDISTKRALIKIGGGFLR